MSGLWTPSGEPQSGAREESSGSEPASERPGAGYPGPEGASHQEGSPPSSERDQDQERDREAELARVRAELAATPVVDIIANHAVGLWQLALLHLDPQMNPEPRLDEARLAIDALGALVDGLGDQLGEHAAPLRDALAQLRMVFVQVQGGPSAS